jgi:hypothetical protein
MLVATRGVVVVVGREHASKNCPKKESKKLHKCIICKDQKANHTAWAQKRLVRRREQERARKAYKLWPKQFQERGQAEEQIQEQVQEHWWDDRTATLSPTSSSKSDYESIRIKGRVAAWK